MNRLKVARCAVTVSVLLLGGVAAPGAGAKDAKDTKSQLAFGVDMAKRGLWSEALFRFEQARLLDPGRVSVLNNLAIGYEAGGRFEEALATYREALRLAPENRVVKQNYSRFAEFYQGYRPRKPGAPATAPAPVNPAAAAAAADAAAASDAGAEPAGSPSPPADAPPPAPEPPSSPSNSPPAGPTTGSSTLVSGGAH